MPKRCAPQGCSPANRPARGKSFKRSTFIPGTVGSSGPVLGDSCTNPLYVEVCNQIDLSNVEALLAQILTEAQAVNANTDTLEALTADVNTNLVNITNELGNLLTELQAINANTDTVEALIQQLNADLNALITKTFESGCSTADGRFLLQEFTTVMSTGVTSVRLLESDGVTVVADGSQLTKCANADYEAIEKCFEDINDSSIRYQRVTWFDTANPTAVVATVWIDTSGNVVTAPNAADVKECASNSGIKITSEQCYQDAGGSTSTPGTIDTTAAITSGSGALLNGVNGILLTPDVDMELVDLTIDLGAAFGTHAVTLSIMDGVNGPSLYTTPSATVPGGGFNPVTFSFTGSPTLTAGNTYHLAFSTNPIVIWQTGVNGAPIDTRIGRIIGGTQDTANPPLFINFTTTTAGTPNSYKVITYSDGEVIATDALGNLVDVSGGIPPSWTLVDCKEVCNLDLAEKVAEAIANTPDVAEVADGVDIPNNSAAFAIPVAQVRTFTVTNEGSNPVVINTPSGTVTMNLPGSRTFGSARDNVVLDTSAYTIATGTNSNADVIWEA